jgi:L-ascorbate metabolism protein UlaG (beta-lactamase superfamily)
VSREADYTKLPKADLVPVTHHHGDHLDAKAMHILRTEKTQLILMEICAQQNPEAGRPQPGLVREASWWS